MKRSDYGKAASAVHRHYHEVLDELTEEILRKDIDPILESYSHKLWYITACLEQLRHASKTHSPAQVAKIDCSRGTVKSLLAYWLQENVDATIISLSILDNAILDNESIDELTCIIVFRLAC